MSVLDEAVYLLNNENTCICGKTPPALATPPMTS